MPVGQMADRDAQGQRQKTGDAEPEPHLACRQVNRLGEIQHSGGEVEAASDGRDEVRGREDALAVRCPASGGALQASTSSTGGERAGPAGTGGRRVRRRSFFRKDTPTDGRRSDTEVAAGSGVP